MTNLTQTQCEEQFKELDLHTQRCIIAIVKEMKRAEDKHPNWPLHRFDVTDPKLLPYDQDFVFASAIVVEEVGELVKACIQFQHEGRRYSEIPVEAVQTGAMALRFLKNLPDDELEYGVNRYDDADDTDYNRPNAAERAEQMNEYQKLK